MEHNYKKQLISKWNKLFKNTAYNRPSEKGKSIHKIGKKGTVYWLTVKKPQDRLHLKGHSTPSSLKLKKVPTIMVSNFLKILTVALVKC